jgi:glycosyltransferase
MPTFSIITPVKNSAETVLDCLKSVGSQVTPAHEHIIVDGESSDGTREIISQFSGKNIVYISSQPRGIYDALNVGIRKATGDVIGILHADDFYPDDRVLRDVSAAMSASSSDTCYGDKEYVSRLDIRRVVRHWQSGSFALDRFYWGWMPPHLSFYARRSVYESLGLYRTDMGTAADYELMLRFLLKERVSTTYVPRVIVKMRVGGASNITLRARLQANAMDRKAWSVNGLKPYPWTIPLKPLRKIGQWVRAWGMKREL